MSKGKLVAIAIAALTASYAGASAAPLMPASPSTTVEASGSSPAVTQVQYRRGGGYYRGGRGWRGPGIGLGIGAAVIAGAIIADRTYAPRRGYYYDTYDYSGPYYYPEDYRGDPRTICARHFRSFEWRTGLYTAYSGEKRMCPYLN